MHLMDTFCGFCQIFETIRLKTSRKFALIDTLFSQQIVSISDVFDKKANKFQKMSKIKTNKGSFKF